MSSSSSSYLAAVIPEAHKPFQFTQKALPTASELKANEVLIKVEACGVCHSDVLTKEGYWPGIVYPRVCGHEVVGTITLRPADSHSSVPARFGVGVKVGRGWHGYMCLSCERCLRGDFMNCEKFYVTGIHADGGYQQYMISPWNALALVPAKLTSAEAAPLLCAGVTVFNAIRAAQVPVPSLVAVQGLGGLGHLGVQYAAKMGYKVAAISRGTDKQKLAEELGAHHYIDAGATDPAKALQALGGAALIVATATDSDSISPLVDGLAPHGILTVVGADAKQLKVSPIQLITGSKRIQGFASGTPMDSQDALEFAAINGVRPYLESFKFEKAEEAYARMLSGKARFRVVLEF